MLSIVRAFVHCAVQHHLIKNFCQIAVDFDWLCNNTSIQHSNGTNSTMFNLFSSLQSSGDLENACKAKDSNACCYHGDELWRQHGHSIGDRAREGGGSTQALLWSWPSRAVIYGHETESNNNRIPRGMYSKTSV